MWMGWEDGTNRLDDGKREYEREEQHKGGIKRKKARKMVSQFALADTDG